MHSLHKVPKMHNGEVLSPFHTFNFWNDWKYFN